MCGICGVFRFDREEPVSQEGLERMTQLLAHRGPDEEGFHLEPGLGFGHRRLAIIGVSDGQQPLANENGEVWVCYNGEIYNYRGLRDRLIGLGHEFRTSCDTEVLVHLYEEEGPDFVSSLRGQFGLAIWDRPRRRVVLARDPLGQKPMYYRLDERGLVFSSELKGILSYPGVSREVNREAIHHYLSLGYVPSPLTAFEGISSLPAGALLEIEPGRTVERSYWDLEFAPREASPEELEDELDAAISEAVECHLESEVPLGVFLSGGVDSSAIAHRAAGASSRQLISTTVQFEDSRYDESPYAQHVADLLGTDHRVHLVGPDSMDVIERLLWHFDQPFGDSSALPTFYLSRTARESITVAISGDGGDEMFAGYNWYRQFVSEQRMRQSLPGWLRTPIGKLGGALPGFWRGRALLENLGLEPGAAAANAVVLFGDRSKRAMYSDEFRSFLAEEHRSEARLRALFESCESPDLLSRVQFRDYMSYLSDDILAKVDRMSMAHSLEVRPPLVDHKLVELVATFPAATKLRDGESKVLFKKVLARHLPIELFDRPKQGFSVPLTSWFQGELRDFLRATLFDGTLAKRGYFEPRYLERLWKTHQNLSWATIDLGDHLWALVMLELWHRRYIDSDDFLTRPYSLPDLTKPEGSSAAAVQSAVR